MSDADSNDSEQIDPRLIEVVMAGNGLRTAGGTLHRLDQNKACHRDTNTTTKTDLTTAAVADGRSLCKDCEWPDGAEEVLQS